MKNLILTFLFALMAGGVFAQNSEAVLQAAEAKEPVYRLFDVQKQPVFPGGEKEMFKYIQENLHYHKIEEGDPIPLGRIVVQFVIRKDGTVSDVEILKDPGGGMGEEARRLIEAMPIWQPGQKDGLTVSVQYMVPITICLK